jgi:hypothetical protein
MDSQPPDQPPDHPPIAEQLKQVVDDLDLEGKVQAAVGAVGQYVHDHREAIDGAISQAASRLDGQTGGRFSGQLGRLQEQLAAGVASLAEHRPATPEPPPIEPPVIDPAIDQADQPDQGESPGSP